MPSHFVWLAALGPLGLIVASALPASGTGRAKRANDRALSAGSLALAAAIASAVAVALFGTLRTGTLGAAGLGAGIYLDTLSAAMYCLVSFVGLTVIAYSRNYLDGDPGQARFTRMLCATLGAVLLAIVSGNVVQFALAWVATSVGLNRLLLFYPERPAAAIAARKEFIISRIGDLSLLAAMILLYRDFGTLDYTTLFSSASAARDFGEAPLAAHLIALCLILTAMLKSAQFPLHGWLVEVMETPTPVSALLHAGIINAGGFLVLRFANLVAFSLPSLEVLAIVGAFTALFGSVVMLTQTSIKVSLAYSTIAQMGFMMLECGLAAFPAAMLHIVAHSLYKAHAFLSSGSVIDISRSSWTLSPGGKPHPARQLIAIAGVLAVAAIVGRFFGASLAQRPGAFTLGAVLLLGLIHLVAGGIDERPRSYVVGRILLWASVVGTSYFALQYGAERLFEGALPAVEALHGPFAIAIVTLVIVAFAAVTFFQSLVPADGGPEILQAAYAHVAAGLYVNTYANRLVLKFWPPHISTVVPIAISREIAP